MGSEAAGAERGLEATYLDVAPVVVVVVGADHAVRYANLRAADLLGGSPGELVGRDWFELAAPEHARVAQRREFDAVMTGGSIPERFEGSIVSATGEARRLEWRAAPLAGADGRAFAAVISGRDITQQRSAMEELVRQAARFRVLAAASHAFAEVALDQDALLAVIARSAGEIIGDVALVHVLSEDGAALRCPATHMLDAGLAAAYRAMLTASPALPGEGLAWRVIAQNAPVLIHQVMPETIAAASRPEWRDVVRRMNVHSLVLVPMRVRGAAIGAITLYRNSPGREYGEADQSLLQDLADRAALAVENARLHASLERRIAERTAALEAALGELESFSYSVAHDLRAPLRGIDGFSLALLEDYADKLDADGVDYLKRVRGGTKRMAELIDDLLALSRVTRGELPRMRVDLSALTREVVAELRSADPHRVVVVVVTDGLVVDADPRLLRIALENLIGNAWKFSAKRPSARIELGVQEGAFYVRDDGAGFDMAHAGKLFGVFQRLHAASEFEGTGVGLATVQRIVRRHGGRIWAESTVGEGATFFFTLDDREATA